MELENDIYDNNSSIISLSSSSSSKSTSKSNLKKNGKKKSSKNRQPLQSVSNKNNLNNEDEIENTKQSIEEIYQKKTPLEHILCRPDTYIGSIEKVTQPMWVYDIEKEKMQHRNVTYVPGLYKIFDEILVNAADNKQRDDSMNTLKVNIDTETNEISVWNNGKGIPIQMHKEYKIYVPELIFGHLLTGSNFNDNKKKTTGGRNGYGAKLANIFSNEFIVETADKTNKKKYVQVFENNMGTKGTPKISSYSNSDYTCITFKPDLKRFNMTSLDNDIVSLFMKRVYDIAGVTTGKLQVVLNGNKLKISKFNHYIDMYSNGSDNIIMEKPDDRWQIGIGSSDDGFQQVSFVNSIATTKGGQHVNYIVDQVTLKLIDIVKKKNKGDAIKPAYVKNHLFVFVSALIENPAFDSQTKENLTTRQSAFGSKHLLSDEFLKKVEKSGIVEKILQYAKYKQNAELRRKTGGKQKKITGITKLDDANFAGTAKGKDCTLILTEGDSAKALAMSGLSVVGRDYYGAFPLKGKLLNVREASHSMILKNEEIQNIMKILGLKIGQTYESVNSLRYGHLMIMADQDHDGSHIKGLVINFIHHYWPSLLQIDGFLQEFITPIVKATKGSKCKIFYTMPKYEEWKEQVENLKGWSIKYYKGLGTSTSKEAKEYFSDLNTHQIDFKYEAEEDTDAIDMAFSKKRVEDRKEWLNAFQPGNHIDYDVSVMPYKDFVDKELILFSMADNVRSIPCFLDGLKPSQRKVLFACFKRNLKSEIKVAQLAGYVSEHSAYHHGEMSLNSTIINMAQNFVGSNNINLLVPSGQFGTRMMGGKDAASPRYVFTKLEKITRVIFNSLDDPILEIFEEDGQKIEPKFYVPILPMVLVNGSDGIGTGWSTGIPNFNPIEIIDNLKRKINGDESVEMSPWYRGFKGTIQKKNETAYIIRGVYEVIGEDSLLITELPIKSWTQNYKQHLENLVADSTIIDFKENHTDTTVHFTLKFANAETMNTLIGKPSNGFLKKLKLESSITVSNMTMFDSNGRIKKYSSPEQVIDEFYPIRLNYYEKRKESILMKLNNEKILLENKVRFIEMVINDEIVINNRKKNDLLGELKLLNFEMISSSKEKKIKNNENSDESSDNEENESESSKGFDYLLSMKIWNLTNEKINKLKGELSQKLNEYNSLLCTSPKDLWLNDLSELTELLKELEDNRVSDEIEMQNAASKAQNKQNNRNGTKKKTCAKKVKK